MPYFGYHHMMYGGYSGGYHPCPYYSQHHSGNSPYQSYYNNAPKTTALPQGNARQVSNVPAATFNRGRTQQPSGYYAPPRAAQGTPAQNRGTLPSRLPGNAATAYRQQSNIPRQGNVPGYW